MAESKGRQQRIRLVFLLIIVFCCFMGIVLTLYPIIYEKQKTVVSQVRSKLHLIEPTAYVPANYQSITSVPSDWVVYPNTNLQLPYKLSLPPKWQLKDANHDGINVGIAPEQFSKDEHGAILFPLLISVEFTKDENNLISQNKQSNPDAIVDSIFVGNLQATRVSNLEQTVTTGLTTKGAHIYIVKGANMLVLDYGLSDHFSPQQFYTILHSLTFGR